VFFASLLASTLRAELSLTPHRQEYELEGVKMWRLAFDTGTPVEAKFRPPEGWEYSGSAKRLNLRPPDKAGADGNITILPAEDFPSFDETGAKRLAEISLSGLPEGAEEAKVESEAANPLQIAGKDTYLLVLSYTFYGERYSRYCLYLVASAGPMRCQLTCRQSDYPQLSKSFQKSLYTWQHL
jgi:hypothetical protein